MEFDGEAFGTEIVNAIRPRLTAMQTQIDDMRAEIKAIPQPNSDELNAPSDLVEEIAKAVALLAESPVLHPTNQTNPVVVNFSPANMGKKTKTITTRRDETGNLVARVVED